MSEMAVLVADYHELFRAGLDSLLAGAEEIDVVGQASSGGEAVRLAAELHPHVVLLDLSMPDGHAATEQIVAHSPTVRVIALAVTEDDSGLANAFEAGACGYLLKNLTTEDVVAAIRGRGPGGSSGVREPRRPRPETGGGGAQLQPPPQH